MITTAQRDRLIIIQRSTATTDDYGASVPDAPDEFTRAYAKVRFGTAAEKREAAQERADQTATFECDPTPKLSQVVMTDSIQFDGSDWDITEIAPLDRQTIRFTAARSR